MKNIKKIIKYKLKINNKIKKNKKKIIENKKVHIKRNKLYNKRNIISNLPNIQFKNFKLKIESIFSQLRNLHNKEEEKIEYIIFRIKDNIFQSYKNNKINNKLGIKIQIIEKLYKEFEKEINKIAKLYYLKIYYINNPFKTTTKKGILIRMGKGKGKIIENKKILEKNKIILILKTTKNLNPENLYILLQKLNKLNNKYFFLSKLEKISA